MKSTYICFLQHLRAPLSYTMGYVLVGSFYIVSTYQFPAPTKPVTSKSKAALVAYNECSDFLSKSKDREAFASCDLAIKLDSEFPEAYYLRARANRYLGKHHQSLPDYDRASALLAKQGFTKEAEEIRQVKESRIYFHKLKKKSSLAEK